MARFRVLVDWLAGWLVLVLVSLRYQPLSRLSLSNKLPIPASNETPQAIQARKQAGPTGRLPARSSQKAPVNTGRKLPLPPVKPAFTTPARYEGVKQVGKQKAVNYRGEGDGITSLQRLETHSSLARPCGRQLQLEPQ